MQNVRPSGKPAAPWSSTTDGSCDRLAVFFRVLGLDEVEARLDKIEAWPSRSLG